MRNQNRRQPHFDVWAAVVNNFGRLGHPGYGRAGRLTVNPVIFYSPLIAAVMPKFNLKFPNLEVGRDNFINIK
jgi:hypothetical protein